MASSNQRIRRSPGSPRVPRTAHGFSLIELMIVVLVLGVLMAIAYPSYEAHVTKTRRAVAASCALEAAQFMERFYTTNMSYLDPATAAAPAPVARRPAPRSRP